MDQSEIDRAYRQLEALQRQADSQRLRTIALDFTLIAILVVAILW